jgi:hypothetical protein
MNDVMGSDFGNCASDFSFSSAHSSHFAFDQLNFFHFVKY